MFKKFNMEDIYPYHSSEKPLHPNIQGNSRLSFSHVEEINIECLSKEFMKLLDQLKPENQSSLDSNSGVQLHVAIIFLFRDLYAYDKPMFLGHHEKLHKTKIGLAHFKTARLFKIHHFHSLFGRRTLHTRIEMS